jgi:hypothetical protein
MTTWKKSCQYPAAIRRFAQSSYLLSGEPAPGNDSNPTVLENWSRTKSAPGRNHPPHNQLSNTLVSVRRSSLSISINAIIRCSRNISFRRSCVYHQFPFPRAHTHPSLRETVETRTPIGGFIIFGDRTYTSFWNKRLPRGNLVRWWVVSTESSSSFAGRRDLAMIVRLANC